MSRIQYDAFVVDVDARTIEPEVGGRPRHLSGQAIETFVCLHEHIGQVVPRSLILKRWSADCSRSHDALTHAIHELREAFDDDHREPRCIRTVRNRGYQLLTSVSATEGAHRARDAARWLTFSTVNSMCGLVAGAISWAVQLLLGTLELGIVETVLVALVLIATLVIAYGALILTLWRRVPAFDVPPLFERLLHHIHENRMRWITGAALVLLAPTAASIVLWTPSARLCKYCVAVMPFIYEGNDQSHAYLAYGIPDELIAVLSRLPPIQALSGSVTLQPRLAELGLKRMGRRLQVAHVVEGRVTTEGDEVRVTVKLIDTVSSIAVWSQTYQRRLASVFELYDMIATQVAIELQIAISPQAHANLANMQSPSDEASALYLQGRDMLRRPAEGNVLEQASDYFQRAIATDIGFARAYAGLCQTKVAQYRATRDNAFISPAAEACNHATELDPKAPEVQIALAKLYIETKDLTAAERAISAALELNSGYYEAQVQLGDLRWAQQRIDDAERAYQAAIELQPGNWIAHADYGALLVAKADYAGAEEQFQRVLSLTPQSRIALSNLGACYMYEGRLEEAVSTYERLQPLEPNGQTLSNLGLAYYYLGRYADAVKVLEKASALAPDDYRVWGNLALAQSYSPADAARAHETYSHAVTLAMQRLAVDPADVDALTDLATDYAALGDVPAARRAIAQAISLVPDDGSIHHSAAVVYELLGARDEALAEAEAALRTGYPRSFIEGDARLWDLTQSETYQNAVTKQQRETNP